MKYANIMTIDAQAPALQGHLQPMTRWDEPVPVYLEEGYQLLGPILLTWFNFNPSMDK